MKYFAFIDCETKKKIPGISILYYQDNQLFYDGRAIIRTSTKESGISLVLKRTGEGIPNRAEIKLAAGYLKYNNELVTTVRSYKRLQTQLNKTPEKRRKLESHAHASRLTSNPETINPSFLGNGINSSFLFSPPMTHRNYPSKPADDARTIYNFVAHEEEEYETSAPFNLISLGNTSETRVLPKTNNLDKNQIYASHPISSVTIKGLDKNGTPHFGNPRLLPGVAELTKDVNITKPQENTIHAADNSRLAELNAYLAGKPSSFFHDPPKELKRPREEVESNSNARKSPNKLF